jgi:hypothetical protein
MIYMNPAVFEALSEVKQTAVVDARNEFEKAIGESGELVGFAALADPSNTATVRVRDDVPAVTHGPYLEAKHLAGFYVVDCETVERAKELATTIPDARLSAVEVRPVMEESGLEM